MNELQEKTSKNDLLDELEVAMAKMPQADL